VTPICTERDGQIHESTIPIAQSTAATTSAITNQSYIIDGGWV